MQQLLQTLDGTIITNLLHPPPPPTGQFIAFFVGDPLTLPGPLTDIETRLEATPALTWPYFSDKWEKWELLFQSRISWCLQKSFFFPEFWEAPAYHDGATRTNPKIKKKTVSSDNR